MANNSNAELLAKKGDILLALEDFAGLTEDELSFKQVRAPRRGAPSRRPPGRSHHLPREGRQRLGRREAERQGRMVPRELRGAACAARRARAAAPAALCARARRAQARL